MSDATMATTPTTAMNMAVVTITSAASAIARVAMPAKAERPTRLRRADGVFDAVVEPDGRGTGATHDLLGEPRRLLSHRIPDLGAGRDLP